MARHVFIPFVESDFICRKCGVVVANPVQMQAFIDEDECISDYDPRCGETHEAIQIHVAELESVPVYKPSTPQEFKRFVDWLYSADPVKALWGIK